MLFPPPPAGNSPPQGTLLTPQRGAAPVVQAQGAQPALPALPRQRPACLCELLIKIFLPLSARWAGSVLDSGPRPTQH